MSILPLMTWHRLDAWWKRWPSANVGLNCGGSGIIALDADSYKDTYAGEGPYSGR